MLNEIIILRADGKLKKMLEEQAKKMKISSSALARGTLAICLIPKPDPNMLEQVMARAEKERNEELYTTA